MLKKYFSPLCLALLLILCVCCGAQAAKEEVVYAYIPFGTERSDAVLQVQEQLIKLFYLSENADFTRQKFDETTYRALEDFCVDKHLEHLWADMQEANALTPELQKFILEGSPSPKVTPTPAPPTPTPSPAVTPFPSLHNGDTADAVNDVQAALFRLGYFDGVEGTYHAGTLDDVTEEAIRKFCDMIRVEYDAEEGLTPALYSRIVDEDAPKAPTPEPTTLKFLYYNSTGDDVRKAQNKLNDLGYFRNKEPEWGHYDAVTNEAVTKFCSVNGIPTYAHGMDETILDRLFSDSAKENPAERQNLRRGDDGDTVKELQDRLFTLGYYANRTRTNKVDDDMLDAVADFATINHYSYENQTIIPLDIQDGILAASALPYEETKEDDIGIVAWLTGTISFMGLDMPRYLVILLSVVIVAGLAFLLIRAFGSGKKKNGTNDSWNEEEHQPPHGQAPRVELRIEYDGETHVSTVEMDKPLRIGRAEKTLPLNPKDTDISRRHCQMYFRGDALLLRDYSSNGTIVNDQKYNNCECVVRDYDTVRIGGHSITVRILK